MKGKSIPWFEKGHTNIYKTNKNQKSFMKKGAINLLKFFFISFTAFAQSTDTGILYLWELSSGKVWKKFGDEKTQQIYKGERSEEHTSELQSLVNLVCRLLLDNKKFINFFYPFFF